MPSLLEDPNLAFLLTKNTLRPGEHRHLNELETDDLFDNVMYSALDSAFYAYVAKVRNKVLRHEFGTQESDRRLIVEECLRLKT